MPIYHETIQSRMVLDTVKKLHNHPTVEEVYQNVKMSHPNISKATVYRNLQKMETIGRLRQIHIPDSPSRFDDNLDPHYHFHCQVCGRIIDAPLEYDPKLNQMVSHSDFSVEDHDIIFKGTCKEHLVREEN